MQYFLGCHFTYQIEIGLKMGSPKTTSTPHLSWEAWASNAMENSSHSSASKVGVTIHTYQAAYICYHLLLIYQLFLQTNYSITSLCDINIVTTAQVCFMFTRDAFLRSLKIVKFANNVMDSYQSCMHCIW